MLGVGERIPEFEGRGDQGEALTSEGFAGRVVVLFFLPQERPARIREASAYREGAAAFAEWGAELLGVVRDHPDILARFGAQFALGYPLLSDLDGQIGRVLGVAEGLSATFVVRDGLIAWCAETHLVAGHVERVLAALNG